MVDVDIFRSSEEKVEINFWIQGVGVNSPSLKGEACGITAIK